MKSDYKFLKFKDGWWIVIYYVSCESWGKWRGPYETKADAQLGCANTARSGYEL